MALTLTLSRSGPIRNWPGFRVRVEVRVRVGDGVRVRAWVANLLLVGGLAPTLTLTLTLALALALALNPSPSPSLLLVGGAPRHHRGGLHLDRVRVRA